MSFIFIIGMPGAGKTYYAKLLSEQYGYDYVDLDDCIETKEGKTVSNIFNTHGEEYFRKVETECLKTIAKNNNNKTVIVACGGGTPAFGNNLSIMKEHGCVVYIETDMTTLAARIKVNIDERPMFTSVSIVDEVLFELYKQRKQWYEQADYTLSTNEISLTNFDKIIASCTGKQ